MKIEKDLTNRHTIASYFARTHLSNGLLLGGDQQQILARAKLTATQLKQVKSRVLATQLASIVKSCWRVGQDELLGFTEQKLKVGMFALLAERLISCKTLEEVLTQTARFYKITGDQLQFTIKKTATLVSVRVDPSFKTSTNNNLDNSLLSEFLLLICHRFCNWLVGQVIPLRQVHVQHDKPAHHEEYRLMYPCQCVYKSENNALVFDTQYLSLPVSQNTTTLSKYLKQIPLQWFKKQSYYDSCSAQVLHLLENSKLDHESSLESIAIKLNMTSRTLRRKLVAQGSQFQQLKDNTRRDRAINLFEQAELSIAQIGLAVGFNELATFSRAFKQWTGVSPSTYRNYRSLSTLT